MACKSTRQDKQTSRHDPPAGPADGERRSSLGLTCTKFLASQARSLNPVGRTREAHTRSLCALYACLRNEISAGQVTSTRIRARACHSEIKYFRYSISRLASSPWMILQGIGCIPTHFASHVSAMRETSPIKHPIFPHPMLTMFTFQFNTMQQLVRVVHSRG